MPLIDITCSSTVTEDMKRLLADAPPCIVSVAVECVAEPYDGQLQPGDVILRFRDTGPWDRFELDLLMEIGSKFFDDRASDRQRRADQVRDRVRDVVGSDLLIGVYLSLPQAAWAQTE